MSHIRPRGREWCGGGGVSNEVLDVIGFVRRKFSPRKNQGKLFGHKFPKVVPKKKVQRNDSTLASRSHRCRVDSRRPVILSDHTVMMIGEKKIRCPFAIEIESLA